MHLDLDQSPAPEDNGRQRAAKADDAEVPFDLWDETFWDGLSLLGRTPEFIGQCCMFHAGNSDLGLLDFLQSWVLRVWRY